MEGRSRKNNSSLNRAVSDTPSSPASNSKSVTSKILSHSATMSGTLSSLGTFGALSLSVVSSVSIVICNKALMSSFKFNFGTTLTAWHLGVTFFSLHVARMIGLFEHKSMDRNTVFGFGILNGSSIGFLNLCLAFNSVGFYQMTKLAIIPCTVFIQTLFLNMKFSFNVQLTLFVLLLGVGIATVTDLQLNFLGSVIAIFAIVTTCLGQILTNTIQKQHKVSSTQLLYQTAPIQAITLLIVGPFLDYYLTEKNVFYFDYDFSVIFFISLSCLIAVAVNFSTFLVIGRTSPVTYQVLGHLKTCLVLGFGYMLLSNPFSWRNVFGIMVAMVGMIAYSYVKILESSTSKDTNSKASEDLLDKSDVEKAQKLEMQSPLLKNTE